MADTKTQAKTKTTQLTKEKDGTIKITITIPWADVAKAKDKVMADVAKKATIPGFRPGKAPRKVVEEGVDKQKLQEDVLKEILPHAYIQAVQNNNLRPIMNPKIHVETLRDGEDWVFTALTCEVPEIKLGDYKKKIQDVTAKSKIVIPGKEKQEPSMDEIMKALLESVTGEIPQILLDQEVERLLSQLLDEIKRLGLTLDQYLASTGKSPETLRKEYEDKARSDIMLEFALKQVAEDQQITVDQKEIEEAIQKAKTPKEKSQLEGNKYLLASILRQQKTLDFLKNL